MVQGFKVERSEFSGNIEVVYVQSRKRSIPKISRWETTKIFSWQPLAKRGCADRTAKGIRIDEKEFFGRPKEIFLPETERGCYVYCIT